MKSLAILALLVAFSSTAGADKVPLCKDAKPGESCQEQHRNGNGWTFYGGGKLKPKPVPPIDIEWGFCAKYSDESIEAHNRMTILLMKPPPLECTRQLGFGSDGSVKWRDPRKK